MIPFDYITEWRAEAPWIDDAQVEQDLVISRALVEIFSHPVLAEALALRGGTALSKLQLRALNQRKQARDLFDLEIALTRLPVEPQRIVAAFLEYMVRDGHPITRAQVEQNLALKMRDGAFLADLSPLLATGDAWDPIAAEALISLEPWPRRRCRHNCDSRLTSGHRHGSRRSFRDYWSCVRPAVVKNSTPAVPRFSSSLTFTPRRGP